MSQLNTVTSPPEPMKKMFDQMKETTGIRSIQMAQREAAIFLDFEPDMVSNHWFVVFDKSTVFNAQLWSALESS